MLWASKKLEVERLEDGDMVWMTECRASKTHNPSLDLVSLGRKKSYW